MPQEDALDQRLMLKKRVNGNYNLITFSGLQAFFIISVEASAE